MTKFSRKCYEVLQRIPRGKLSTYKIIAHGLNSCAYRAVGQAMKTNPHPIDWPCHRVVMSNGEIGGYALGKKRKVKLLQEEGIEIKNNKVVNLDKYLV